MRQDFLFPSRLAQLKNAVITPPIRTLPNYSDMQGYGSERTGLAAVLVL